jgi:hypothetical protein
VEVLGTALVSNRLARSGRDLVGRSHGNGDDTNSVGIVTLPSELQVTAGTVDRYVTEISQYAGDLVTGERRAFHSSLDKFGQFLVVEVVGIETELFEVLVRDGLATSCVEFDRLGEHPQRLGLRVSKGRDAGLLVTGRDLPVVLVDDGHALASLVTSRTRYYRRSTWELSISVRGRTPDGGVAA